MVFYDEPIQTVLVSCRGTAEMMGKKMEKDNLITVDWHMPIWFKPGLYGISIGKSRFSLDLIRSSGCFVVNFISHALEDVALSCGRNSGADTDKFNSNNLTKVESEKVDCPRIGEAQAYLECEVAQEIELGDHFMFIGKILGGENLEHEPRLFHTTGDTFIKIKG